MFYSRYLSAVVLAVGVLFIVRPAQAAGPGDVVINELFWMGSSRSNADEWIELRNLTDAAVNLDAWALFKKSGGSTVPMLTLPAGSTIPAKGFFLIANYAQTDPNSTLGAQPDVVVTAVSLVNSDLQITLADATGATVDVADDGQGTPLAGAFATGKTWKSMERNFVPGDGQLKESWHTAAASVNLQITSEFGTPRAVNSNLAPVMPTLSDREAGVGESIPFDASEATDPDGDPLSFAWEFGDGAAASGSAPAHIYTKAGSYTVAASASDGQAVSRVSAIVTVRAAPAPAAPKPPVESGTVKVPVASPVSPASPPNTPTPSVQTTTRSISRLRFSRLFVDPTGVDAGQEFIEVVNGDSATGSTAGWRVVTERKTFRVRVEDVHSGGSLVLRGVDVPMQLKNAGGTLYLIDPAGRIRDGVKYPKAKTGQVFVRLASRWHWQAPDGEMLPAGTATVQTAVDEPEPVTVEEVRQTEANTKLVLTASIILPPGQLAPSQALIGDDTGTVIVAFDGPVTLTAGERIRVTGKKSTAKEPRLRAAVASLQRLGSGTVPEPMPASVADLAEEDAAAYVRLTGTVATVRPTGFTLDDETGTLPVAGGKRGAVLKGERVTVSGVVRLSAGRLRLTVAELSKETVAAPQVASASVEQVPAGIQTPPAGPARTPILAYAFVGVAGALLVARQTLVARLAD